MQFHLLQILPPHAAAHGLLGYSEVIETLAWGLSRLGHQVSIDRNSFAPGKTHILLGYQLLSPDIINSLPPDTILYNLEQLRARSPDEFLPSVRAAAQRFRIWDYSPLNLDFWKLLNPPQPPVVVPIGYAPVLRRIPKPKLQDIDILFYGLSSPARFNTLHTLVQAGLKTMYVSGLYGKPRDELIARSKIVLNLNLYERSKIFEIVRVSYLLANAKAVVSDLYPESQIDPDIKDAILPADPDKILDACLSLLRDDDKRQTLELRGQSLMMKRDITQYLRPALT
ncbi:MAG: hypothetical protein ACTHN5_10095 [Phycisphaerae bacterium]